MTSQALQSRIDSYSPIVNDSMFVTPPSSGSTSYNVIKNLLSEYFSFTRDIPDNTNLTEMQFINEIHATSREIRDRITAGISRQLRLAMEEGEGGIAVSKPSKDSLFEFAKMQQITRPPFVILRDNGNLSTTWNYENGDKFKLVFLCDGSLNYVSFLNRTGKREIAHGNCDIKGVMEFIQSNDILL